MANVSVANTDAGLASKTIDLLESDQTITGLKTFSRGAAVPFAVAVGSLAVTNLNAALCAGLADSESISGSWDFLASPTIGTGSAIAANTQALTITKNLVSVGSASALKIRGYSPSIELLDKDGTANWYMGVDDNASDRFAIGRGYGPNQIAATAAPISITSADVVELNVGQLKFPAAQNPSADANTLDDYEEGTFTPTIGGSGGQSGQAYTTQSGHYIKIGKMVVVNVNITLSTLGSITGTAQIQSLPFTSDTTANYIATGACEWGGWTSNFVTVVAQLPSNSTAANIVGATAAATGLSGVVQANLANAARIQTTIVYKATA